MFIVSSRFSNRLYTCMYLCDKEDKRYVELQEVAMRFISGQLRIKDSKTVSRIEKELNKEINDGDL